MSNYYPELTKELSLYMGKFREAQPEVMQAFHTLSQSAGKEGSLNKKTKELIALGIAIATRCEGCIGFHTKALVHLGVSREEFMETLSMAVYMGGGPSLMYAAEAVKALEEFMPA